VSKVLCVLKGTGSTFLALGMADFQYFPDMEDPVAKLRMAMNKMDGMTAFFCALNSFMARHSGNLVLLLHVSWTAS
jgi:hypothetical protein